MNAIIMHPPSGLKSATRQPWDRMQGESAKSYNAFVMFRDLGAARTLTNVAETLRKSVPLLSRWSQRFNWHNRALDFDEHNDQQMRRQLFTRRARMRKRALDIADMLDAKVEEAIREMIIVEVVKGKKGENGQPDAPDERKLMLSPTDVAQMFRVSQDIQHRILGKDENEEVYEFHIHFNAPDPEFEHEQPEAVFAARKKAREAQQRQHALEVV